MNTPSRHIFIPFLPLLLLLSNYLTISAQGRGKEARIEFEHFGLKDGLPQSSIFSILQDDRGYLWLGTSDGLNRYDGYKFIVYKHDKKQPYSLGNNQIRNLFTDVNGNISVGTGKGISIYDANKDQFRNYPLVAGGENIRVNDILELQTGDYLVAAATGLYEFNPEKGYKLLLSRENESINVFFVFNDEIYYGSSAGVFRYNEKKNQSVLVDESFRAYSVNALLANVFYKSKFWIATESNGLILYDIDTGEKTFYRHNKADKTGLSSDVIRSLCYDGNRRLWIGSFVGLNVLDELSGNITQYFNNDYREGEVSQNSIRSIFRDSQGGMWCGTYYGGLNYYHPLRKQFEHYHYQQGIPSVSDNVIGAMMEDAAGRIWIGTNDNGIDVLNPATGAFVNYRYIESNPLSISGNNVKAICIDKENNNDIWIGLHGGGLCKYSAKRQDFNRINFSDNPIANDKVYAVLIQDDTNMLLGTLAGLFVYNRKNNQAREFTTQNKEQPFKNQSIMALFEDAEKGIWIGTQKGLARYTVANGIGQDERVANAVGREIHEQVNCFHQDNNSGVWIGSSEGLYCYDLKTRNHRDISAINFPDVSIHGILEDAFRRLWISTSDGLFVLDLNSEKYRRYDIADGLQNNRFNINSYCKTGNGKMYFGGINGFNAFFPERLKDNPFSPSPIIDNLTIFNKKVVAGDETGILTDGNICRQQIIRIPSKYNVFGLKFTAPNYLSGKDNNLFAYKLEGFDIDWYYTKNTDVGYSNLSPGTYKFIVKAANNSGKWCDEPAELIIEILPEWYQTWFVKVLLLLSAIGLIYWWLRVNINRRLMKRQLEMERKDKERMVEMEQEKIRFFINVSHEFRTPLTLILSPVEEALRRETKDNRLQKQLKLIQQNALRMLHLVNQVLDYRKAEMGAMKLCVKKVQIRQLTQNIFDLFAESAAQKSMEYRFDCRVFVDYIWIDPNYYERILSNLIGNALKFTPERGLIEVSIWLQDDYFYLEVHDSGCGIPYENREKIFERFHQVEEHSQGTGIGLSFVKILVNKHHGDITVQSIPKEGSVFKVMLPCKEGDYEESEKVAQITPGMVTDVSTDLSNDIALLHRENAENDSEEEVQDAAGQNKSKCILVIEDDKDIRDYLVDNLSKHYTVAAAENGEEAWQKLQENKDTDLIISDVMMPVMDGITFCKKLKRDIRVCHIPVILLTAKSEVSDQLEGLQTGADDYLNKPFVWSVLLAKIVNIFKHRQRILRHYLNNIEASVTELSTNTLDEELLQKAKKIVMERMENPNFSVEELSREMGMSRSNLHLKMKAVTGESAIDFIRHVRLAEACRLLAEGRYNAAEISTVIGFTPSYFSTIFKKYKGCLPTEYAKKI